MRGTATAKLKTLPYIILSADIMSLRLATVHENGLV